MSGAEEILNERRRQLEQEGWTAEHDAEHGELDLILAAMCYATPVPMKLKLTEPTPCTCGGRSVDDCRSFFGHTKTTWVTDPWPWDREWDQRKKHSRRRQLIIAGALIAAALDRMSLDDKP